MIEVCPVRFPGRETRRLEPPFTSLPPLVQALAQALAPHLDKPFTFYGHGMGALVSFELARQLRRQHGPKPTHLFVSGRSAPQIPHSHPPIHALPEPEFLDKLRSAHAAPKEALEQTEVMQLLLPILRADLAVCETYVYTSELPLDCPISVFGDLQDRAGRRDHLEAWRNQTKAVFAIQMIPGDHFALPTAQAFFLRALSVELRQPMNPGSGRRHP
jgi:medium-chain acyl-[acyl-carrier-protein] hydrolase